MEFRVRVRDQAAVSSQHRMSKVRVRARIWVRLELGTTRTAGTGGGPSGWQQPRKTEAKRK